jgi:membrane-bound lytic murein transglycosylase D
MPVDEFRALNPSFNRPLIPAFAGTGAGQANILLPGDRAEIFLANLAGFESTGQPLTGWTAYTVQTTDTVENIAARVGVSADHLREANRIPKRHKLAAGSTVLIPRDESMADDIAPERLNAALSLVPERSNQRMITYRVRRGDTLSGISRRYGTSIDEIVETNRLRSRDLFAGQRLNLMVAARPAARSTVASTQKTGSRRR